MRLFTLHVTLFASHGAPNAPVAFCYSTLCTSLHAVPSWSRNLTALCVRCVFLNPEIDPKCRNFAILIRSMIFTDKPDSWVLPVSDRVCWGESWWNPWSCLTSLSYANYVVPILVVYPNLHPPILPTSFASSLRISPRGILRGALFLKEGGQPHALRRFSPLLAREHTLIAIWQLTWEAAKVSTASRLHCRSYHLVWGVTELVGDPNVMRVLLRSPGWASEASKTWYWCINNQHPPSESD